MRGFLAPRLPWRAAIRYVTSLWPGMSGTRTGREPVGYWQHLYVKLPDMGVKSTALP